MKEQLSSEATRDREAYDKMVCWCDTNNKEKTQAIADADAKIDQLEAEVQERAARGAQLSVDIAALKVTVAERKEALSTATAMREKEQGEFMAQEVESVQAITMLRDAILVLKKHNSGFLQASAAVLQSLGSSLRWVALKHEELEMEAEQHKTALRQGSHAGARLRTTGAALLSFGARGQASKADDLAREALEGGSNIDLPVKFAARILASAASGKSVAPASLAQESAVQPVAVESYSSQSGQVYGILQQLQEDFEASLSASQKEEAQAREAFTELKAALVKEISSTEEKLDEMEEDFGTNTKALSDAKEDLQATRDQRSADVKFLSDLRLECQDLDHQWQTRSTSRSEEIKAVAETIAILTADDARTTFHKKMGTGRPASFLQLESTNKVQRSRAIATLLQAANSISGLKAWRASEATPHAQLSALAVQVQLNAFVKVKKAIDDMVAQLKAQTEHEVGEKAFCVDSFNVNEKATYSASIEIRDLQNAVEALEATIEKLTAEIAFNKKTIAETEVELKQAGSVRKEENQNFKEEVLDQQAIQSILAKAVARLRSVYEQEALLQQQNEPAVSPVKFQPYHKNAGSSPVLGLIEQIIGDSKALEKQFVTDEQSSQTAYAEFVANADSSIKALNHGIETRTKLRAVTASEKADKEAELGDAQDRMESLQAAKQDLHQQCDFLLKNFDVRHAARLQEIEALGAAKAFLSGMATGEVV